MKCFSITYVFKQEEDEFQLCRTFIAEDMKEALRQFWHKRTYSYDDDSRRINHKEKYKIISVEEVFSKDLNISTSSIFCETPEFNINNDSNVYYDYYNSRLTTTDSYCNPLADSGNDSNVYYDYHNSRLTAGEYINLITTTAQQNLVVGGST